MKTHVTKNTDIERKWYIIDADGQNLGRMASEIADVLRGKKKTCFSPSVDCGDYVIVTNTAKVAVTGNKILDKKYYSYSGFPGGMRDLTLEEMLERDPNQVVYAAVKGMLPKNKLASDIIKKLRLFAGSEHDHTAQQPVELKLKG